LFASEEFSLTHSRGNARRKTETGNEEVEDPNGGRLRCSDGSIRVRRYPDVYLFL